MLDLHLERLSEIAGAEPECSQSRPLAYQPETREQALAWRRGLGAPEWEVDAWVSSYEAIAAGELASVSDAVPRLTGSPALTLEQQLLKDYYQERFDRGFEYSFVVPGMTRVVQSAGRVIRSERDVGVIALLCRRFTQESYTRYFPADWYEESPRELVTRKAASDIRTFFDEKAVKPQLRLVF